MGGEIFRTCPYRPWGPPCLLYNGYWVFPGDKGRPGRDADPSPPSSAVGHERVELYLYSPYGPYRLHRASVPVQGCTLHFTMLHRQHYVHMCTEIIEYLADGLLTAAKFIQKDERAGGWRNGRGLQIMPPILLRQ